MEHTEQSLTIAIRRAIEGEVERVIEEVATEAAEKARAAVRAKLGAVSCGLLREYSVTRNGQELLIRVQIKDEVR